MYQYFEIETIYVCKMAILVSRHEEFYEELKR